MKFTIPAEYCLIINAFNQTESLRSAAQLLHMDPPALVRKVRKISSEFGYLQKIGNRWAVTEAGRRVAQWTDEAIQSQREAAEHKSVLRISSFAWLAEEMLIPEYRKIQKILKPGQSCTFKITAGQQEQELIQSRADIVVQGHAPIDPSIAYKRVSSHNWVVVVPYRWKKTALKMRSNELIKFLNTKKFIRHLQMNPETILGFQPMTVSSLSSDGVIGIRSAVLYGEGWSVLPAMSVSRYVKSKRLCKLPIQTYLKDDVSVWWLRARKDIAEPARLMFKWIADFKIDN